MNHLHIYIRAARTVLGEHGEGSLAVLTLRQELEILKAGEHVLCSVGHPAAANDRADAQR